jgi:hypothetical protein
MPIIMFDNCTHRQVQAARRIHFEHDQLRVELDRLLQATLQVVGIGRSDCPVLGEYDNRGSRLRDCR